ncbi:MAG: TIGR03936 family radical SAM-associated protein [Litorilinea sp.]
MAENLNHLTPTAPGTAIESSRDSDESAATATQEEPPRQRVRFTYQKGEAIKFISHQDETRMWERTLRRADLPLLYKQGFNPQPHMQIAAPLGLGFTGLREFIDITFSPPVPAQELFERVQAALPPGATITEMVEVPLKAPSLQGLLIGADYTILLYTEPDELAGVELQAAIDQLLETSEIWRERERKSQKYRYNMRPLILELNYQGYSPATEEHRIQLRVQQRPGATGRPDEVIDALGFNRFARTLQRDRLYFSDQPEDVAVFAPYRIIAQAEISDGTSPPPRKNHRRRGSKPTAPLSNATTPPNAAATPNARSISERAGDEFI